MSPLPASQDPILCAPPKRVLVVDDDDAIREVAQLSLEMVGGYDVLTADCGAAGVACARAQQPDAILLDVMMPELDGPATLKLLQGDPATRGIPVVLLTAKLQSGDVARFATLGVHGVLGKPFDPMKLAREVAGLLDWPR